jgi:predicted PurR-regulated permease PerM
MSRLNALLSIVAVGVVAFFVGYIVGTSAVEQGEETPITAEQAAKLPTVAKGIEMCPDKGPKDAKVTILEFSEFQ